MSYVKTEWATGDVITAQKLNNMEDGIEAVDEYADIFTADVSESVENWLDDHPEATTTVEDGAITTPKLADGAVTTPKLANGSVTDDKLASDGIKAEVSDLKSDYTQLPKIEDEVSFSRAQGIIHRDLTVYGSDIADYNGRYTTIDVTEGEQYYLSGYSVNSNYPCAFCTDSNNVALAPNVLSGYGVTYTHELITIPSGAVKLYVNGNTTAVVNITKLHKVTQNEFDEFYEETKLLPNQIKVTDDLWLKFTDNACFSTAIHDFFTNAGWGYSVIKRDIVETLTIKKAKVNVNVPAIVYFKGEPSTANYISGEGFGQSSTVEMIENVNCTIPSNCEYILIQGAYQTPSEKPIVSATRYLQGYGELNDIRLNELENNTSKRITYGLTGTNLTFSSNYGTEKLSIIFGKRGVNNLPDFKNIAVGSTNLYSGFTDWFASYIVASVNNADGDDISHHYFTGGNHNYNNEGDLTSTATARNISLEYYADGKLLVDGDSGQCDEIRIEFVSRVQGYNTRKADGSGREILEEKHILYFDGLSMKCETSILPLEDITIETWYGYQANIYNWSNIEFVGGTNRKVGLLADHPNSGNNTPNAMRCYSQTNLLEIELDRTFDLGKGDKYNGTLGMFTSGNKAYCYIIENSSLSQGDYYWLRGWYRFKPL